jgi:hypothetical protein
VDKRGIAFTTTEIRDCDVGEWFEQIQAQPWCLGAKIDRPCVSAGKNGRFTSRITSWC